MVSVMHLENNDFQKIQNRLSASNIIMSAYILAHAQFSCWNFTSTHHLIDGKTISQIKA